MNGEFEDRENETLGELPAVISRERRESYPSVPVEKPPFTGLVNLSPGVIQPDVRQEGLSFQEGETGRLGSPTIPASVTSVFDGRPVNARDWEFFGGEEISGSDETTNVVTLGFQVPEGFVGVWRQFRVYPREPIYRVWDDGFSFPTVSLFVDNIAVPNFTDLDYGLYMTKKQDTWVLANAGSTFTLQYTFPPLILSPGVSMPFRLEMYGQLLLTRGLPLAFEVMSQQLSGSLKGKS